MRRALSVRPPWAGYLVAGIQWVENRSWSTAYRGRLWVHESGPGGRGLLGTITLVDVATAGEAWVAYPEQREYVHGPYCWVLADPVPLAEPIRCRGALRLWTIPPAILELVPSDDELARASDIAL